MSDSPSERRFSEEEVRRILAEAVDDDFGEVPGSSRGLTLTELKSVGHEAGIDPAAIERAARKRMPDRHSETHPIVGIPTVLHAERRVDGVLDSRRVPEMLSVIRRTTGEPGEVTEVGGGIEWRASGSADRLIRVSPGEDSVSIEATTNRRQQVIGSLVPPTVFGIMLTVVGLSESLEGSPSTMTLILTLALLPTLYAIIRTILARTYRREADRLERIADDVAGLIEGGGGET